MNVKINDLMNPFGSAISIRTMRDYLEEKYRNFVEGAIEVNACKEKNDYFIYFNIPSKENKKYPDDTVFYDIVIQLSPPNSAWKTHDNIRDWDVRVYNNSPRFVFTFDYAFNKKNGLIKFPSHYYTKRALKEAPKKMNPQLLLGIDENLYHAIYYMDKHNLFDKAILDALCDTSELDWKSLVKEVTPQEDKYLEVTNRDLRHRALTRRKNSKVWNTGGAKDKIKRQLLEESKNLSKETPNGPEGSVLLKTQMLSNLRARLSLMNGNKQLKQNNLSSGLSNASTRGSSLQGHSSLRSNGLRSSL